MTKTIDELKEELIKQAKEKSQIDRDTIDNELDEIIERVGYFMFDVGYEKGWNDCLIEYDTDSDEDDYAEDVADIFDKGILKGKKL